MRDGPGAGLRIVAAGGGKFDVLGIDGKPLNEAPLARSEASLLAARCAQDQIAVHIWIRSGAGSDDAQSDSDASGKKAKGKRG
jgi:hypothetical protein